MTFRTPYRFINTLMNYANKMDERQALHIYRTMQQVRRQFGGYRFNNDRYSDEVRPYMMDDDNMEEMEFDFTPSLEKMIKDMMMGKRSSSHNNNRMSNMDSMMYSNSKNSNNMMKHTVLDMDNPFENPSKRRNSLVDVVRTVLREKEMMESMMKYKKEEEQQYNPFKSSNSYRYVSIIIRVCVEMNGSFFLDIVKGNGFLLLAVDTGCPINLAPYSRRGLWVNLYFNAFIS